MTMNRFSYANASSIEKAVEVLSEGCRPLAGGTDLLVLMKEGLIAPERLVNLKAIPGLDRVEEKDDGWHIGTTTTLSRLAESIDQLQEVACLYEALLQSASPQLRHMATIGGNLTQRPRCWYFRNKLTHCWLKGGQRCFAFRGENKYHAILGDGPCNAVHPSDPAVALLALDASVLISGQAGERAIPLADFYQIPTRDARQETVLALDELVAGVFVPKPAAGSRGTYVKAAERGAWDFALVSAAAQVTFSKGIVQEARIALGGVAQVPWRTRKAEEALVGKSLSNEVIEQAAETAIAGAQPLEQNAYKVDLVQGVVRQALWSLE